MKRLDYLITSKALKAHQLSLSETSLSSFFEADPLRAEKFMIESCGLTLDFSKQFINGETLTLFEALCEDAELKLAITKLFAGGIVNLSENRPASHAALRCAIPHFEIKKVLNQMRDFCKELHDNSGANSKITIKDVISLGIGGSELGPAMAVKALESYDLNQVNIHFVSNVDGQSLKRLFAKIKPETTCVIINSKTFTTTETLTNAATFKTWLRSKLSEQEAQQRLFAVTANSSQAVAWGIAIEQVFEFWDWVGGRYSIWSAVGLPVALAIGFEQFESFLRGAALMDAHFKETPPRFNMPIQLALVGIWNNNFWHHQTQVIIPYSDGLSLLPAYLQQLEMESNGKRCDQHGELLSYPTTPVLWGGVGCNSQHAYMQLLHQSAQTHSIDFILPLKSHSNYRDQQDLMVSSCLSQSRALMLGTKNISFDQTRECPGNRVSTTLLLDEGITPASLGSLLALYEHKVYVQSVIWGCNAFDQWGVQLGKEVGIQLLEAIQNPSRAMQQLDSSTQKLLKKYQASLSI